MPTLPRAPRWAVTLYVTSLALWVGGAVFLSAGVLPLLFLNLEPSEAGRVAALIFPSYFRGGLVAGLLACGAALRLARGRGRAWLAVVGVLVAMTVAQGWSALVLHPEMAAIRGDEARVDRFQELHRLSVRLNSVVLAGGVLLLLGGGALLTVRDRDS